VGERRPSPGWLSEEDTAYERRGVTKDFDDRVYYHPSAYGVESRADATWGEAQGWVEDGVSCRNVDGSEELYEVVGDVVRWEVQE
jgi:hypothetical protein